MRLTRQGKRHRFSGEGEAQNGNSGLEGHNQAFGYFGGVPRTILYDNTKLAVRQILGDGTRNKPRAFSELQSHYLFAEKFGRPGKGNDKGKVEYILLGGQILSGPDTPQSTAFLDWWK